MSLDKKKDGVVLKVRRISDKCSLCYILFSDSLFSSVVINSTNNNITVGHQVFGKLYSVNDKLFFKIESVDFFLGSSFWVSHKSLTHLIKLINCVLEKMPMNLKLKHLYEEFIAYVKSIHAKEEDLSSSFNDWIIENIS